MEKIKVLIADEYPVFREGLCRFLEDEEDLEVVAKATDGEETVRLAKELKPDVAIIDIAMPKLNGIEAARQIKAACPTVAIVIVSAYSYDSYILSSLRAGVAGYLMKNAPVCEFISAIRSVHTGGSVLVLKASSKILQRLSAEKKIEERNFDELQPRELEVLKQAAKGKSNKEIASELHISERTVQAHLINIFKKFRANSRTKAVLHALKEGWLTLDDLP